MKDIPNPLQALQTSLQMEFEYELNGYNPRQDVLAAKKRQLELIRTVMRPVHIQINLARRVDKPVIGWAKLMSLRSTLPNVKEIIEGL